MKADCTFLFKIVICRQTTQFQNILVSFTVAYHPADIYSKSSSFAWDFMMTSSAY